MSARRASRARLVLCAGLLLLPQVAAACAVCGGGNPANRFAFFASTIALSLIPLAMFAAGFLWLRARILKRFADEFRERDDAAAGSPAAVAHAAGSAKPIA